MHHPFMDITSVFVVESLPEAEDPTGRKLFEGTLHAACEREGFVGELHQVRTRNQFFGALSHLADLTEKYGLAPILQLETHGGPDGVELTGPPKVVIPWADLIPVLTRINIASKMNFLVVAGMCYGTRITNVLKPMDRAPALGFLGRDEVISPEELLDGMRVFYSKLLQPPYDLGTAIDALNALGPAGGPSFELTSAQKWFCHVFRAYVGTLDDQDYREAHVADLLDKALTYPVDVKDSMEKRLWFNERLNDDEFWFEYHRVPFLMLDQFPENAARFWLGYRECFPPASTPLSAAPDLP